MLSVILDWWSMLWQTLQETSWLPRIRMWLLTNVDTSPEDGETQPRQITEQLHVGLYCRYPSY